MESFARPIRDLIDDLSWFVRARELRVFHLRTSPDLRATALRLAAAQELHAENPSPWVVLEDPFTPDSDGWLARTERLRIQHEQRRRRMAEEGQHLPDLPERPAVTDPIADFGAQLAQLLVTKADWHDGLVVVLAPTRVENARAFCEAVRALLAANGLRAVRWVLIESEAGALEPIAAYVGEQAMRVIFLVDEAEAQRNLAQLIDAAESAPADISGPARVGAAWPPGVSPPERLNRPRADPESIDEILRKEGIHMPLAGARGTELSRAVLRGAQALRGGHAAQAAEHQARARDICIEADLPREAALMELVLGAYLLAAGEPGHAARTYASAADRAERAGRPDLGAQAHIALGALHLRAGERAEAAAAYVRAAALARQAGSTILTIESLRLAGQTHLDLGHEEETIRLWTAALELAEAAAVPEGRTVLPESASLPAVGEIVAGSEALLPTPGEVKVSSAGEVARALAALFRRRGLKEKAAALEERARNLE
jgi:tetratricopeptide (TPR) repeat protein